MLSNWLKTITVCNCWQANIRLKISLPFPTYWLLVGGIIYLIGQKCGH